MTSCN